MVDRTCSIAGCDRRVFCRGLCNGHYHRLRRGSPPMEAPLRAFPAKTPEGRFWQKVQKGVGDECWLWLVRGSEPSSTYGTFRWKGKRSSAHRVSYELAYGVPPGDLDVCHRCDNPPCVNPAHLFLGSHRENMRDAGTKGRVGGVRRLRYSAEELTACAERHARGESIADIARSTGISRQHLSAVFLGVCRPEIAAAVSERLRGDS